MSVSITNKWKGFKSNLSRIKNTVEELGNEQEISVTFEFDEEVKEYNLEEVPSSLKIIQEEASDSDKIVALIYVGSKLKDKVVLQDLTKENKTQNRNSQQGNVSSNVPNMETSIFAENFRMMMKSLEEVNQLKTDVLQNTFQTQLKTIAEITAKREEAIQEINRRELDLRVKEIESTSKRKIEFWGEILKTGTELVTNGLVWVKENPGDAAEILRTLRAKPVE
ncbi:hypothetical protein AB3N60_17035 [Leptospira sp. WS39.C2]